MDETAPFRVAIIGGGPTGLIAAETLAAAGLTVDLYDRMPTVGRKFLLAGRGGLNLTHTEDLDRFLARYGNRRPALEAAIRAFPPDRLREWAAGLGEPTFAGSSGRVFPNSFKASPLLRAWLRRLQTLDVKIHPRHHWIGWTDDGWRLATPDGAVTLKADAVLLALGGASWPRLGADGSWVPELSARGIPVIPLKPANAGIAITWTDLFRERFAGSPLKRIALATPGGPTRGEAMVTQEGLEGGAVYAALPALRDEARIAIDLRPDETVSALTQRLSRSRGKDTVANMLRKALALPPVAVGLMREATGNRLPDRAEDLARLVKATTLPIAGIRPLDRAISTAGGLAFDALDDHFMLRDHPGVFIAGEMLDWEAPTGGYLLQACFATGVAAANGILALRDATRG